MRRNEHDPTGSAAAWAVLSFSAVLVAACLAVACVHCVRGAA